MNQQREVLALDCDVQQTAIEALYSREGVNAILPRSLPDDVLVALWRSMCVLKPGPKAAAVTADASVIAADWARELAGRTGLDDEQLNRHFDEICNLAFLLLRSEVAYRVARGLTDRSSRLDHVVFLRRMGGLRAEKQEATRASRVPDRVVSTGLVKMMVSPGAKLRST